MRTVIWTKNGGFGVGTTGTVVLGAAVVTASILAWEGAKKAWRWFKK